LGRYRLISLVGMGGMGEVYQARDDRLGRDVAVKVLPADVAGDPARLARFEREARATAALEHANILAVYDVGRHEGQPYLVTQLLEGETLSRALAHGPMPASKAIALGVQIARGLAAAHERGIIHRDLKPSNIFLTSDGGVKILDFGLARISPPVPSDGQRMDQTTATDWTLAGAVVGTVGYMAPEQVRGQPADSRSDIFAFGCVLYEMLAGRRAFLRDSSVETLGAILHEDPLKIDTRARSISPPLVGVLQRCLEKRPEDRFQSTHDLALALESVSPTASLRPLITLPPRWPWRRWAVVAAGVIVAMLAVVGLSRIVGRGSMPDFDPLQLTSRPELESEPAISPSGTDVAYVGHDGEQTDIWVVDAHGGQPLRLTSDGTLKARPAWFPDGSAITYAAKSDAGWSVWKVPRLGGSPLQLVPDAEDPAISPDGSSIAYIRPGAAGFMRIEVASLAAPLEPRVLTADGDGVWDHRQPVWSPDGTTICYHDQNDLWLIPVEGGSARQLTADDASDFDPAWSPSGRWVYFASSRQQTNAIWRVDVARGGIERVTMGTGQERSPTLSRSGGLLAYSTYTERTLFELVDTATMRRSRLDRGRHVYEPVIAPDRSSLVFTSNVEGFFDLWRVGLTENEPAGELVRLTEQSGSCAHPAFSPDGRWLAYHGVSGGQRDVWILPADGGPATNLSRHPAVDMCPEWSPDGTRIAFVSDRSGIDQLWIVSVDEGRAVGEPEHIAGVRGSVSSPSWSADGSRIALVESAGSESDVWTVAVDGTQPPRKLTEGSHAWFAVWNRSAGEVLVLGTWGAARRSIRAFPADGGEPRELPGAVASDRAAMLVDFDVSNDGQLLVLLVSSVLGDVWVLEAKDGRF
jgi:Tol biopolymer transport system component